MVVNYKTIVLSCVYCLYLGCESEKSRSFESSAFRMGYKRGNFSSGPLTNSGFLFKVDTSGPTFFLTAHHCVAGKGREGEYYKWNEIAENVSGGWIWSMVDSTMDFPLGSNLPIENAETLKLDVAAFYLTADAPYLLPSDEEAKLGDTVKLLSRIVYGGIVTMQNPAIVTYTSDSVIVYELLNYMNANVMYGTSGSAVLNDKNLVVSNSYGGFTYSTEKVKSEIGEQFPLIYKIETTPGKIYGIGVPMRLIESSIRQATKEGNEQG